MPDILNALLGASIGAASQGSLNTQFQGIQDKNQRQSLLQQIQAAGGVTSAQGQQLAQQDPNLFKDLQAQELQTQRIGAGQEAATQRQTKISDEEASKKRRETIFSTEATPAQISSTMLQSYIKDPSKAITLQKQLNFKDQQQQNEGAKILLNVRSTKGARQDSALIDAIGEAKRQNMPELEKKLQELTSQPREGREKLIDAVLGTFLSVDEQMEAWKKSQPISNAIKNKLSISGVQQFLVDGETRSGRIVTDPLTGESQVSIPELPAGVESAAETPTQKSERQTTESFNKRQQAQSLDLSKEAFKQIAPIKTNIANLDEVTRLIDAGAETGVIASKLPSIRENSIALGVLQNQLGLDVVGSVTFGALSQGELDLALKTALPLELEGEALKDWVLRKKSAQEKLINNLNEAAIAFGRGMSVADFIESKKAEQEPQKQGGQIMVDASGNKAMVFPDGTFEELP